MYKRNFLKILFTLPFCNFFIKPKADEIKNNENFYIIFKIINEENKEILEYYFPDKYVKNLGVWEKVINRIIRENQIKNTDRVKIGIGKL